MSKFTKFIAGEITNLAVGYLAGLTASNLVSRFFVKKGWSTSGAWPPNGKP